MPDRLDYRRQAESLLRRAAAAENMAERSRLIDEAARWHMLAFEAADATPEDLVRSEGQEGSAPPP